MAKRFAIWDLKEDAWCAIALTGTSACAVLAFKDRDDANNALIDGYDGIYANPRFEVRMIKVVVPGVAL